MQDRSELPPINSHGLRLAGLTGHDRRQVIPLDAAYFYLRHLELKLQPLDLFKICNSLQTIDVALSNNGYRDAGMGRFTARAWLEIRDRLFQFLIMNFAGRFDVRVGSHGDTAITRESGWPVSGLIKFYPTKTSRPTEYYTQSVERLQPSVVQVLRTKFEIGQEFIEPADCALPPASPSREATSLLQKFYDICEDEAERGKSSAHHLWSRLEAEAKTSSDRQQRKEITRRMNRIERLWGSPKI